MYSILLGHSFLNLLLRFIPRTDIRLLDSSLKSVFQPKTTHDILQEHPKYLTLYLIEEFQTKLRMQKLIKMKHKSMSNIYNIYKH